MVQKMAIEYRLSHTKCSVMYVGNTDCNVCMTLNDNVLSVVDEVKDLGVIVDSHLSLDTHISKTVELLHGPTSFTNVLLHGKQQLLACLYCLRWTVARVRNMCLVAILCRSD